MIRKKSASGWWEGELQVIYYCAHSLLIVRIVGVVMSYWNTYG